MKRCSSCPHWHKQPANPNNLGAPPAGECRGAPPQLTMVMTPAGPAMQVNYPLLPSNFPACALHPDLAGKPARLELATEN